MDTDMIKFLICIYPCPSFAEFPQDWQSIRTVPWCLGNSGFGYKHFVECCGEHADAEFAGGTRFQFTLGVE